MIGFVTRDVTQGKKLKLGLILILLLFTQLLTHAQSITPEVQNVMALSLNGSGKYIDMSVGEIGTSTISNENYTITQGFLQPIELFRPCTEFVLEYYPNPVQKEVTIISTGCDLVLAYVEAYDTFGQLVLAGSTLENKVNMENVGVGVYLLRAYDVTGQAIGTVKIVKTTI
jgi:hypothetical protein